VSATSLIAALVVLLFAPLLPGIAAKTVASLTGRRGAPVWQPWFDLARLVRKGSVISVTTSWVFRAAPLVLPATALIALALLPLDGRRSIVSFPGDPLAFAALLALGRFAIVLAGLDTGSSFEGMGASRALTFSALTEPLLLLAFVALALATGALSLSGMLGVAGAATWAHGSATLVMTSVSLFVLLLAEAGRVPVDDPATHLELTMIHEVVVLDHSGPDLALIQFGAALQFAAFAAVIVGLLTPRAGLPPALAIALLPLALGLVAVLVGVVESVMARLRLDRVPRLLLAAAALSVLGVLLRVGRP